MANRRGGQSRPLVAEGARHVDGAHGQQETRADACAGFCSSSKSGETGYPMLCGNEKGLGGCQDESRHDRCRREVPGQAYPCRKVPEEVGRQA